MGGGLSSKPWREIPDNNDGNLDFMKSYSPRNHEVTCLRILLHGPVGAGKSSFINSVDSVLQRRVTGRALTDTISGTSFTRTYKTYHFQKSNAFYKFCFNDIMGLEQKANKGVNVDDLKLALKGHVKEGYKFIPEQQLKEGDLSYNPSPTLDDQVHVLVSVIPVGAVSLLSDAVVEKMRDVRLAASNMGIPQLTILTKVDEACPSSKSDVKNVYKSIYLEEQVKALSQLLGLPPNCIFLVKNFNSEVNVSKEMDRLILYALRQMVSYGEDFLNNL